MAAALRLHPALTQTTWFPAPCTDVHCKQPHVALSDGSSLHPGIAIRIIGMERVYTTRAGIWKTGLSEEGAEGSTISIPSQTGVFRKAKLIIHVFTQEEGASSFAVLGMRGQIAEAIHKDLLQSDAFERQQLLDASTQRIYEFYQKSREVNKPRGLRNCDCVIL